MGSILFTIVPALRLPFSDTKNSLSEGGRGGSGRGWKRIGRGLVVAELAITVVLLVSAGLLGKSFYRLMHIDSGIAVDHLVMLHVSDPQNRDSNENRALAIERKIVERLRALPGVKGVGVSSRFVFGDGDVIAHYRVRGRPYTGQDDEANQRYADVGYFETLPARLRRGRLFAETDDATKPRVAVINQTMATQAFGTDDPIGQIIESQYDKGTALQVVGVINDVKEGPLDMKARAAVYAPFKQTVFEWPYVTVRTEESEEAMLPVIARAIHEVDRGLIVDSQDTMRHHIDQSEAPILHRASPVVALGFASFALLLGTVGLYGVIAVAG